MSDAISRRDTVRGLAIGMLPAIEADAHQHGRQPVGAASPAAFKLFSAEQREAVAALSEAIIPTTDSPGAKAAGVPEYIDWVLSRNRQQADAFLAGLAWLEERCRQFYGNGFAQLDGRRQAEIFSRISDERADFAEEDKPGAAFFRQLKALVLNGYYTSQIGMLKECGYKGNRVLRHYAGCDGLGKRRPGPGHRHAGA